MAINREKLALETTIKDIKEAEKALDKVQKEVLAVEADKAEAKNKLDSLKERGEEDLKKLNAEIKAAREEIETLKKSKVIETDNFNAHKENLSTQAYKLTKEHDASVKEGQKDMEALKANKLALSKEVSDLSDKKLSLETAIQNLNYKVESVKVACADVEKKMAKVSETISSKKIEYDNVLRDVAVLKGKKSDLEKDMRDITAIIATLKVDLTKLEKQKAAFDEEKQQFIKDKMALQQDREDLTLKEEVIKEKYENAGIKYL